MTYDLDLMILLERKNILDSVAFLSKLGYRPRLPVDPKELADGGFSYTVSWEQMEEYRTWSYERRLQWLMTGNLLRKSLPLKTINLQDAFREGKI